MNRRTILLAAAGTAAIATLQQATAQTVGPVLRIVITGHSGRIGSSLVRHWQDKTIVGLSLPGPGTSFTQAHDLRTYDDAWVSQFAGADCVVHLAGAISFDFEANMGNIAISQNVLRACLAHGVKRLVYASSATVNADLLGLEPPITYYNAEKQGTEHLVRAWAQEGRVAHCMRFGHFAPEDHLPLPTALIPHELVRLDDAALHYWMDRVLGEDDVPYRVYLAAGKLG